MEEVKTIVLNRKRNADEATTNDDFLTALGWDEALESILDELRVLPLKDDTKKTMKYYREAIQKLQMVNV